MVDWTITWKILVCSIVLWFGLASIFAGTFTAYFGAAKSRIIGIILFVLGLLFVAFLVLTQVPFADPIINLNLHVVPIYQHIAGIVGAILGGFVAISLFLILIMKS